MKEPAGLLPGSDDRPADVLIPFWTNGQDSTLDVTVVNPLQAGLVVRASQEGQSAVKSAHYARKVRKHEERCPNEGITFTPLALDTLGGWHPVALATINRLGSQLAKNVGREEVNLHYFFAADYLRLPKFSLTNWCIFRENTPNFHKFVLCMVLWTEPPLKRAGSIKRPKRGSLTPRD